MTPKQMVKLKEKLPIGPGVLALNCPAGAAGLHSPVISAPSTWDPLEGRPDDGLNKLERKYLGWLLHGPCKKDDIWVGVQCITLRMAHDVRLTMDFAALDGTGLRLIDTKATNRSNGEPLVKEDAMLKMRQAATLFSWIRFVIAWERDGLWEHRTITTKGPVTYEQGPD